MNEMQQGIFPLRNAEPFVFENFLASENGACLELLEKLACQGGGEWPLLSGESGLGKTHLLKACVHRALECQRSALYLDIAQANADIIHSASGVELVCVDNVHTVAGKADLERALFDLFNQQKEVAGAMVFASEQLLQELDIGLPDLRSRLAWGQRLQLKRLADDEKAPALELMARGRGFRLDKKLAEYLLRHYSRNLGELSTVLETLARESIRDKRRITLPYLKEVLGRLQPS